MNFGVFVIVWGRFCEYRYIDIGVILFSNFYKKLKFYRVEWSDVVKVSGFGWKVFYSYGYCVSINCFIVFIILKFISFLWNEI